MAADGAGATGSRPGAPVVVLTDGQPGHDGVLRFAAREAALRGCQLIVVCPPDPSAGPDPAPGTERAGAPAERMLVRALGVDSAELPPYRVLCGVPDPGAQLAGAALLVIGRQHLHLLDRLAHSWAGTLWRKGHVPVAVVPAPAKEES